MKPHYLFVAALMMFPACNRETKRDTKVGSKEVKEKIDDALDRRPNEKLRDVGEEVKEGAKETKEALENSPSQK